MAPVKRPTRQPIHRSLAHSELTFAAQKSTAPIVPQNAALPSLTSRKTVKDNDTRNMRITERLLNPDTLCSIKQRKKHLAIELI